MHGHAQSHLQLHVAVQSGPDLLVLDNTDYTVSSRTYVHQAQKDDWNW